MIVPAEKLQWCPFEGRKNGDIRRTHIKQIRVLTEMIITASVSDLAHGSDGSPDHSRCSKIATPDRSAHQIQLVPGVEHVAEALGTRHCLEVGEQHGRSLGQGRNEIVGGPGRR